MQPGAMSHAAMHPRSVTETLLPPVALLLPAPIGS